VDQDVAVVDELARSEDRGHEVHAVDHDVEAPLEQADHVLGRVAAQTRGFLVDSPELPLAQVGVVAAQLLLGGELLAEARDLAPLRAMLAGRVVALDDRVLGPAPEVDAEATADLVLRLHAFVYK